MQNIGEIIRRILFFRKQSITDFARSINMPSDSVVNVIYKNVRKKDILEKVSKGLGVNLLEFIKPINTKFDLHLYNRAASIVNSTMQNKNIICSKDDLENFNEILYKFLLENKKASDETASIFCEGMFDYALNNFMVTKEF